MSLRSKCPLSCALDILGDKWSLLIIRDMLHFNKKTFKDFFASNENIATNILSSRLKRLESFGIISKNKLKNNKKSNIYKLTNSGLKLIPAILELSRWGSENIKALNSKQLDFLNIENDREKVIKSMRNAYINSVK
ncbi:MAG: hypothetical protein CBE24_04275 [bacterium TMED264]|nr:MAG: hypothetical protein CBE24_04275 [bacterium TMED264]